VKKWHRFRCFRCHFHRKTWLASQKGQVLRRSGIPARTAAPSGSPPKPPKTPQVLSRVSVSHKLVTQRSHLANPAGVVRSEKPAGLATPLKPGPLRADTCGQAFVAVTQRLPAAKLHVSSGYSHDLVMSGKNLLETWAETAGTGHVASRFLADTALNAKNLLIP